MKNHLIFGDEKNKLDLSKHKNTCTTRLCAQLYLNFILTIKKPCVCRHRKYSPYFKAVLTCTYTYTRAIHTVFSIDVSMENQNWLILCKMDKTILKCSEIVGIIRNLVSLVTCLIIFVANRKRTDLFVILVVLDIENISLPYAQVAVNHWHIYFVINYWQTCSQRLTRPFESVFTIFNKF